MTFGVIKGTVICVSAKIAKNSISAANAKQEAIYCILDSLIWIELLVTKFPSLVLGKEARLVLPRCKLVLPFRCSKAFLTS